MKKTLFFFTLVLIALVAIMTCPSREMHKEEVHRLMNSLLQKEILADGDEEQSSGEFLASQFLSALGNGFVGLALVNHLEVENYFVFSVGKIRSDGETYAISYGVFNHIFLMEKQLTERLNQD